MKKILAIAKASVSQYLVYRLSFVLWRLRAVLGLCLTFFLWRAAFSNRLQVFHYSQAQINTYILLTYVVGDLVFSSRLADLSGQIRNGAIINQLLKPFPFLRFTFIKETVDKFINLGFSVLEIALFVLLLKPELYLQTNGLIWGLFLIAVGIGATISFFISFSLSLIAFWSTEVWAPRFVFNVLLTVAAGSFFPLDILPRAVYQLILLTPFPYLTYLPTKIYLDGASIEYVKLLVIGLVWVFLSYQLALWLWRKGMREFAFFGR